MPKTKPPPLDMTAHSASDIAKTDACDVAIPDPKQLFDWKDWLSYWEHLDCSEDEKRQLIEAYWLIMVEFMKIKYGLELSDSEPHVDKSSSGLDLTTEHRTAMVQSELTQKEKEDV